jgi:hypothetical protein
MMYMVGIGLGLAMMVPLGLLFAFVRLDPRVRSASQIKAAEQVPLLVTIPFTPGPRERSRDNVQMLLAFAMVAAVFGTYALVFYLRTKASS